MNIRFLFLYGVIVSVVGIVFLVAIDRDRSLKSEIKMVVRHVKSVVYSEATIYNPSGDVVPDWIDDVVLGKIRDIF